MKYLILGGAGFIGSHLSNRLLHNGHTTTVIDSLATSNTKPNCTQFIRGDVRTIDIEKHLDDCDVVYHLAASVGVAYIDQHPQTTLFNNIEISNRLVPLFEQYQKKVIYASSSEIYGEGPFKETDNASIGPSTNLRWGYATSKLLTEFMFASSTFPYAIVRFFNVTGPGQLGAHGMVLPKFVNSAKSDRPLFVYGNGLQTRSFCHINDALDALELIEKTDREIFNVGSDNYTSIADLANRVVELSGSKSTLHQIPYHVAFDNNRYDIYNRSPDITKLRQLGYEPKYSLDDIIQDMLHT